MIRRLMTCGSVDDGKSTLIGRLLYDTGSVFEDHIESLVRDSKQYGTQQGELDYALLLDGLLSERDQGITIDVAYRYFDYQEQKFIIADSPGHEQYTRNMATAASQSDTAVILVDASQGVTVQTKRHCFIAATWGIRSFVFAVNKMDLVGYESSVFERIQAELATLIEQQKWSVDLDFIPLSALKGENLVQSAPSMAWYKGATLMEALLRPLRALREEKDFRFPVQFVNRLSSDFRGYAGTISDGRVSVGDEVLVTPSNQRTRIREILTYQSHQTHAQEGDAVTLVLEDERDISRGDVLIKPSESAGLSDAFRATLVWMGESPCVARRYDLQIGTLQLPVVLTVESVWDLMTFTLNTASCLSRNDIAEAVIQLDEVRLLDVFEQHPTTGSFILVDAYSHETVAAGVIQQVLPVQKHLFPEVHQVNRALRAQQLKQTPRVIWLTGLSASGKSTLANALEVALYEQGYHTYLLDGDNLRTGLNQDLGFSTQDRKENIRRAAHLAQLLMDSGAIVITAFISPFQAERDYARSLVDQQAFIEVFLNTSIEECVARDPKGLYAKAKKGEIPEFTGISSPYEVPTHPEVTIQNQSIEESVQQVLVYLKNLEMGEAL